MEFYKVKCWPFTGLIILIVLNRNLFPAEKSSESLQCLIDLHADLLIRKPFAMMVTVRSYCKAYSDVNWAISPRLSKVLGELLWVSRTFCLPYCLLANAVGDMGHEKVLQRKGNLGRWWCPFSIRFLAALRQVEAVWIRTREPEAASWQHFSLLWTPWI